MKQMKPGLHVQVKSVKTGGRWFDFGAGPVRTEKATERRQAEYMEMYAEPGMLVRFRVLDVKVRSTRRMKLHKGR